MQEVLINTHLIVTDVHSEYSIRWVGKILDAKPKIENGKPIFIIVGGKGRVELNTTDMKRIEDCAKTLTEPKGRTAVSTDTARIYIKEIDDNEMLMGLVTHNRVKTFSQMMDKVGWR